MKSGYIKVIIIFCTVCTFQFLLGQSNCGDAPIPNWWNKTISTQYGANVIYIKAVGEGSNEKQAERDAEIYAETKAKAALMGVMADGGKLRELTDDEWEVEKSHFRRIENTKTLPIRTLSGNVKIYFLYEYQKKHDNDFEYTQKDEYDKGCDDAIRKYNKCIQSLNYSFAPIGIKQLSNNKKDWKGWVFLSSEIVVPAALGIGFGVAATGNYIKHKNQKGQTLTEHKDFYDKYKKYHCAAIWTPIVAEAVLYGLNIWCNYQCTNKNTVSITPQTSFNLQGDLNMGLAMSINF